MSETEHHPYELDEVRFLMEEFFLLILFFVCLERLGIDGKKAAPSTPTPPPTPAPSP